MNDNLYSARLEFKGYVGENSNQVLFVGNHGMRWGDADNNRAVEGTEFKFDRKYWELMGKPEFLCVGMGNQEAFDKWVGENNNNVGQWLVAAE